MEKKIKLLLEKGLAELCKHIRVIKQTAEQLGASVAALAQATAKSVAEIEDILLEKQDKLTGTKGQVAGFDANGQLTAQNAPTAADIGAAAANHTHTAASVGAVPTSRKVNGKPLSADISLSAADVGAAAAGHAHDYAASSHTHTAADVGAVPTTRTVNKKALSANISLTASDVGAAPTTHTHNYASPNHTHTAADVGAATANHTHTAADVGAAPASHGTHVSYSTTAPKMDGTAAVGTAGTVARSDHVHPTDTSRAPASHTHTASDVGAAVANHTHTAAQVGARPNTWMPSAADVGAAPASHTHGYLPLSGGTLTGNLTIKGSGNYGTKINLGDGDYVHIAEPTDDCLEIKAKKLDFVLSDTTSSSLTINGTALLSAIGAAPASHTHNYASASHTHTASDVGAVPASRKVNGKPLSADISLSAADVGAAAAGHTHNYAASSHTHTAAQAGLGNVPNVSTNDQTPTYTQASALAALASGEKLSVACGKLAKAVADLIAHIANKSNPHGVTAAQVGARPNTWTPTAADVGAAAASHGTHVSYSSTAPKADGTAAAGTAGTVARSDHVHPTDTSRAPAVHTHTRSQITDFPSSLPASDVYDWAKAASKPAYTASEVGAAKKPLSGSITIPKTGWSSDSTATYSKYYDISVTGVTTSDRANVDIAAAAWAAAIACGLCPITETLAGKIRIRAASVPAETISAHYFIEKGA